MSPLSRAGSALALFGLGAVVASAVTPTAAAAQFNFSTRGYFSSPFASCNQGAGGAATVVTCSGGGFTIRFTGVSEAGVPYASGATANLGAFDITGTGNATIPPATVAFTLLLDQTAPAPGPGSFSGFVGGSLNTAPPGTSTLVWSPNEISVVAPVTYDLVFGGRTPSIAIPLGGPGAVDAVGTVAGAAVVPEPTALALVATGLLALGGAATRRTRRPA